jgi:hypothetical protein
MTTFLRTQEFLSLELWLGSDVFLSFVVAPGRFTCSRLVVKPAW